MIVPKAELHVHLEGSATPRLMRRIAKKNNIILPSKIIDEKHDRFVFEDFLNFINVYDDVTLAIQSAQDYYDITYDYLEQSALHHVIYTELTASPDHAFKCGIHYEDHLAAITRAIDDARRNFNIEARIIMVGVRHWGVDTVEALAKKITRNTHPYIVGFGLAGDERRFPPALFKRAFQMAHHAGLGCTAHAGEHAGPESIFEAIHELPITRLGHGVRAIEDPRLLDEIKNRNITLECCPSSNITLGIYKDIQSHPFLELFQKGVKVTLNSDDPPYFKTSIAHEYYLAKTVLKLTDEELYSITRNAIEASFVDTATKKKLLNQCIFRSS